MPCPAAARTRPPHLRPRERVDCMARLWLAYGACASAAGHRARKPVATRRAPRRGLFRGRLTGCSVVQWTDSGQRAGLEYIAESGPIQIIFRHLIVKRRKSHARNWMRTALLRHFEDMYARWRDSAHARALSGTNVRRNSAEAPRPVRTGRAEALRAGTRPGSSRRGAGPSRVTPGLSPRPEGHLQMLYLRAIH